MRRAVCAPKSICPAIRRGAGNSRPSAPKSPTCCGGKSSRRQAGYAALRPRPTKEIVPGSQLDETDVAEAELMVEFVGACRTYAHELAVNEMTMRSYTELQNYLESGTKVLLDGLRQAGDADRPFRQSQMDAAIRFCR